MNSNNQIKISFRLKQFLFLRNPKTDVVHPSPYYVIRINDYGIEVQHCATHKITMLTRIELYNRLSGNYHPIIHPII
jgi:hypothetical protein